MSVSLARLLHTDEVALADRITRLERVSGLPGIDSRLVSDIIGTVHMKSRELGLDPKDSTGLELYQALLSLTARHDEFLCRRFGISDMQAAPDQLVNVLRGLPIKKQVWAIKASVVKKLLKSMPPKACMKALGYRSIDSMLKRESAPVLVTAARILESENWRQKFMAGYAKLTPADFESRPADFVYLDETVWGHSVADYVLANRYHVITANEVGVIALLPISNVPTKGYCLLTTTLLLEALMEQRAYSAYFKLSQTKQQFGRMLSHSVRHNQVGHVLLGGEQVHWRTVAQFLGHGLAKSHHELLEPHIESDDLVWVTPEVNLYGVEPALHFWHGTSYVASGKEQISVSFNLIDMAINYANGLSYTQRSTQYCRESLWNELYMRYLCQDSVSGRMIEQLETEIFDRQIEIIRKESA